MKIITLGKYGALGNNFFRYIHLFSYAKEYNIKLYYSDRKNIDKYFQVDKSLVHNRKTPVIFNSEILRSLLRSIGRSPKIVKFINKFNIYLHDHINLSQKDEQLLLAREKKNSIVFVLRDFRAHPSLANHINIIRKAFDIKPELTKRIDVEYQELRREYKILLGVHVRRGDYKEWNEGKYYFSDTTFAKKIREFIAHKNFTAQDVGVIICSNGTPLIKNFSGLNVHYAPRPEEEDLFLMKRCDYIIAPPSTFCSMSSFLGSVPLYFIEDENTTQFEERLHICNY